MTKTLDSIKEMYQRDIGPHIQNNTLTKEVANNIYRELFQIPEFNRELWEKHPNAEFVGFELVNMTENFPYSKEEVEKTHYSGEERFHILDSNHMIEGYRVYLLNEPNYQEEINQRTIILKYEA